MTLVFPLGHEAFFARLPAASVVFDLPEQVEMSGTGGGEILTAEVGPQLWTGEIGFGTAMRREIAPVQAMLHVLRQPGATFLAGDTNRPFPVCDPDGVILGQSSVALAAVASGSRAVRLSGLPPDYLLAAGDYLSFTYGTNPVRHALHMVVDDRVAAGGDGLTPEFQVVPHIRPGATAGAVVRLAHPVCKMRLVPASVAPGTPKSGITRGGSFRCIQTLR